MIIRTPDNYYTESDMLFTAQDVELNPGLTVLVGCNGSGKSTFIKMIEASCKENGTPIFSYNALRDGRETMRLRFLDTDIKKFMLSNMISEGENVINDFGPYVEKMCEFVKENRGAKEIMITIDAVDSGLSIDGMRLLKDLFGTIIKDTAKSGIDTYIVISANAYELSCHEICLYPAGNEYMTFSDYETYKNFVLKSAADRDKRYKRIKTKKKHD